MKKAAAKIQAGFKGMKLRKEVSSMTEAAIKIQARFKGMTARKRICRMQIAATTIQAGFKGMKIRRELNHGGYKCPGNNLYRPPRQCSHQPARPAARPGPAPPHHRSTAVASHHTPTQTFWSLILYNVTHKNNTYKGMSHNGDKYYNLTMIEPNIGSCNLVILPQG